MMKLQNQDQNRANGVAQRRLQVILISTYDLGRQPFGLSSPAAWLVELGHEVTCLDLSIQRLDREKVADADLVAFHIPMHTATRVAVALLDRIFKINPSVHLCFYGLYAPLNRDYLYRLGIQTVLGGEFESGLVALAERLSRNKCSSSINGSRQVISLERQRFVVPDRSTLPSLDQYAFVQEGASKRRIVGYTETTRGCKHLCRHCPIVPVYNGQFRVVQREVVLEDIRRQVAAGAEHVTFGDPDFLNGPGHAVKILQEFHGEFPGVTYDVTIKVEHLLKYARYLPVLKQTGCLFITSAVESIDDRILEKFDKGHTRNDFVRALSICRSHDLLLNPTFVTFTPWTTTQGFVDLLRLIIELELIEQIAPIQYAIRLLIPSGSRLLELDEMVDLIDDFDESSLCYPWRHPDPAVDHLYETVMECITSGQEQGSSRHQIFEQIWCVACENERLVEEKAWGISRIQGARQRMIPHLSEPWYC